MNWWSEFMAEISAPKNAASKPSPISGDEIKVVAMEKTLQANLTFLKQTVNQMDVQVTALQSNITALAAILNTFFADVTAALAAQAGIDPTDEAAITASNASLTALVTGVQQQIAALPAQPAPAPSSRK
jgi:hypothetical protein